MIAITLLALIAGAQAGSAQSATEFHMFKDVPTSHWACQAVYDLKKMGILQGYPKGTPFDGPLTTLPDVKVVPQVAPQSEPAPFKDIDRNTW